MPTSASDKRHFYIVGVLIAITTVILYWLLSVGLPLPYKASVEADTIDWLIDLHLIVIAFLFAIVVVFMLYSIIVFRRKKDDTGDGEHFEGNTLLEVVWTAAPLILVFIFMYIGWDTLNAITTAKGNELVVKAIGQQWSWSFEYENGVTSPELVLPVNQPIRMDLETKDVIHAFWVQEFRVKEDVTPGRTNHVLFTVTKTSQEYMDEAGMEYKLRCAELCGTTHWNMLAPVKVVNQAEFDTWLKAQAAANNQAVAKTTK